MFSSSLFVFMHYPGIADGRIGRQFQFCRQLPRSEGCNTLSLW